MILKRVVDDECRVQFVTSVCEGRRRFFNTDLAKRIVLGNLCRAMRILDVQCVGFVIMLNHLHAILHLPIPDLLDVFMQEWKRKASGAIRQAILSRRIRYPIEFIEEDAIWIHRYYPFPIYTEKKLIEKLKYMHMNPVRAGLVQRTIDWPWSSARDYELGEDVGVPITWVDL